MPRRSDVGQHIVSRIDRARRLDPSLSVKSATAELGISESSYYKLRAGTRSGKGSIFQRVIQRPSSKSHGPQGVANAFTVTMETASGRRVSRNVDVGGARTKADALVLRHDPKFKQRLVRRIVQEEKQAERRTTGSPPLTRRDQKTLRVVEVRRRVFGERPALYVREGQDWSAEPLADEEDE